MSLDLNRTYDIDADDDEFSGNCSIHEHSQSNSSNDSEKSRDRDDPLDSTDDDNESEGNANVNEEGNLFGSTDNGDDVDMGDDGNSAEGLEEIVERRLDVGSVIDTLEEVYVLYCEYARLIGFSVKKGTQSYFMNSMDVRLKVYHCCCEGYPDNRRSCSRLPSYTKQSLRSNCKARLRVCRDDVQAPWTVSVFVKEHNHDLVDPSESYLLRSARNVSQSKKTLLLAMTRSGIGVSRAYRFVENEAGSRENVGFLPRDAYNELDRERRMTSKLDNADANKLLEYLTQKGLRDPSFYWKVKVGDDGRLTNLYFRDTRSLVDYQHFGDVLSVDATYKTNKYDLICVPLVGINHHKTNVMFAIAFLSNERAESYQWLFSTFLESMYQKEPSIIFSDQDQALMNGVDCTFVEASHRLCQWHINKNAVKHFGKLNNNKHFKALWYRCMNGCETEEQFEAAWKSMIEEHNLLANKWFCSMYNLRKRWSSAFTSDKFCGGLHATSRSEVTNKVLKDLCSRTSSVYEFVLGFERLQKSWRRREFEEDSYCRGMPGMVVHHTDILVQVAKLCTRNVFKSFQYEALHSISVRLTHEPPDMNDESLEFKVSSKTSVTGYRVVKFNQCSHFSICSCRMWETEGVLCRHLFRVYFHLNFQRIPDEMILSRWRKDSKERIASMAQPVDVGAETKFSNMLFVNHNTKLVYDILSESKDDNICRDALSEYIRSMIDAVKRLRIESTGKLKFEGHGKNSEDILHPPLRNPNLKKKRPYRRHKLSRNLEGNGSQGAKRTYDRSRVGDSSMLVSQLDSEEDQCE